MKVLVTGGTGMVGSLLCKTLVDRGDEVIVLTRNPEKAKSQARFDAEFVKWEALFEARIDSKWIQGLDAVVNLAGEPLAEGRWTAEKKKRIVDSRGAATRKLLESMKVKGAQLKCFVSASAMGFYGDRGDETLGESAPKGHGFLSDVCEAWERPVEELADTVAARSVVLRISLVLSRSGGFLGEVLPIFRRGAGGNLASGQQWMSWIHENDLLTVILQALDNENFSGVVNCSSPEPCQNFAMTKALSRVVGMPAIFPVPKLALKMVFGEKAEMLLASQRLSADKLAELGFFYQFPDLDIALKDLVKK